MANPKGNPQNLKPAKPGEVRNPNGRPKGSKSLSTIVQNLLEDEELAAKVMKKKPSWWRNLPTKNAAHAIVAAMMIKAMGGDDKAATWLRKTGWGEMLDVTSGGNTIFEQESSYVAQLVDLLKQSNEQPNTDTTDTADPASAAGSAGQAPADPAAPTDSAGGESPAGPATDSGQPAEETPNS